MPRYKKRAESTKNGAEWERDGAKCAMNSEEERDGYFQVREGGRGTRQKSTTRHTEQQHATPCNNSTCSNKRR